MQSTVVDAQDLTLLRKKKRVLIICAVFLALLVLAFYVERQDIFFSFEMAVAACAGALLYAMSIADWLSLRARLNSSGKGGSWIGRAIYALYIGIALWLLATVIADVYYPGAASSIRPTNLKSGILTGAVYYAACHLLAAATNALVFRK